MAIKIRRNSALRFGDLMVLDGIEFWDVLDLPTIPEQPDDIVHTVTGFDRLDLLARDYYGDPALKWVIAVRNDIELDPVEVLPGERLIIPSPRYVRDELFQGVRAGPVRRRSS